MKSIYYWLPALFLFISVTVNAQEQEKENYGFSGRIQAGALFFQTDSQLIATDNNLVNHDLKDSAETYDNSMFFATGQVQYQFKSGTTLYVGNPLEVGQDVTLAAGVTHPMDTTTLDVAVTWLPFGEVWKNPYLTGKKRQKSDLDSYGLRLKLTQILGSPWEAEYKLRSINVEEDDIGDLEADLQRDGRVHELGIKYTIPVGSGTSIRPDLGLSFGDIKGKSNRYHGVSAGVLCRKQAFPWIFIGRIGGSFKQYDSTHPIFNETRDEWGLNVFGQVMRLNLFGVEPLFASLMAGYGHSDANIDFFDSHSTIAMISTGVNF